MDNPKIVSVVVDNDSWILPYAQGLTYKMNSLGHDASLVRAHKEIREGFAAFYIGCTKIVKPEILKRNRYNMVAHQSDLPKGRGWSPMTWQILEGKNDIPVCLFEAVEGCDVGDIFYRDIIHLRGDELVDEWRDASGRMSADLCLRFMNEPDPDILRKKQEGDPTFYERRLPEDSRIDPNKSIAEQFNQFRVADNNAYPIFFMYKGVKYILRIDKTSQ